jgi:general secretion pathway protein L
LLDSTIIRQINGQLVWYPPGMDKEPVRADSEAALEQFAAAPRGKLCFAVPGTDVSLLRVEFEAAEKKHITKSLPFTLEEQLASDIDELHFSTALVDEKSLCAAVCSNAKMHTWQQALVAYSAVNQWTPEPHLLPWQKGEWTLVLEDGYAIVRTGDCEGFSVERELLPGMLRAALQDAVEPPTAVIVYGQDQAAERELFPEGLHDCMQWRRGDLRAAMLLSQEDNITVNLLQGSYAQQLPLNRWWRQWRTVAVLFAAVLCLQLVTTYASYLSLEQENLELRREIQNSYRRAFPKGALVDAEKQVKRQLDVMRGTAQSSGFINLMNRVGGILAAESETRIESISYNDKGNEMRLNITARDFEAVEAIRVAMTSSGLNAVMENSNVQGERVRARLRVGAGS